METYIEILYWQKEDFDSIDIPIYWIIVQRNGIKEKQMKKEWIEFDECGVNLAKEKGFSHLTEKDISEIVSAYRQSN